jgi:hypothetical protein
LQSLTERIDAADRRLPKPPKANELLPEFLLFDELLAVQELMTRYSRTDGRLNPAEMSAAEIDVIVRLVRLSHARYLTGSGWEKREYEAHQML